jgi:hypothetical protein
MVHLISVIDLRPGMLVRGYCIAKLPAKSRNLISSARKINRLFLLIVLLQAPLAWAEPDATELDEVIFEHQGQPEPELPLGLGISGETLRTTPGSAGDPLRSLQSLPGMVFTDDESAVPAVRGSRPNDNYMEADFLPVGYLFHAGGVISVFNSELMESFNIYPSAYGPEFSGVTGGVFDIRLRDPVTDQLHSTLDVGFLHAGLLVEGPVTDNQSFYLAGRFSYLDLLVKGQLEDDDGIEFRQFPKYTDYQGKYVWKPGSQSTLRFQVSGATDEQDIIIAEDSEEIELEPIFAGRHSESENFNQQGLVWDQQIGGQVTLKSALAHNRSSSEAQAGGAGQSNGSTDSLLLKSHLDFPLNEQHDVKLGFSATRIDASFDIAFNDPGCTEFEADCQVTGAERLTTAESLIVHTGQIFAKDSWYVTDSLTLFPGVTLQAEDYLGKQFVEPRFALEYSLSDDLIFSAGTGVYHQLPGFVETNKVFGNPDLEYIESVQAVVGVQKILANGLDIKSELYYKELDNLVAGDEELRFNNAGEGVAYGLDTLIRKDVTDKLTGWLSFSVSKARREHESSGASFPFDYDQPVNMTLVANYKLPSNWALGAKLWVHSGAPYTPVIGAAPDDDIDGLFNPQYGEVNSKRLPTYHRLDVRLDRTYTRSNGKHINLYMEVLNLLDSKNLSYYDYNADYSERIEVTQLPRIVGLGFKVEF